MVAPVNSYFVKPHPTILAHATHYVPKYRDRTSTPIPPHQRPETHRKHKEHKETHGETNHETTHGHTKKHRTGKSMHSDSTH